MNLHELSADGPPIASGADALGVFYEDGADGADWIVVPVERLDPAFFDLRSGVAGDIAQKVVNYRVRLAVVGDISKYTAQSAALTDFVREANRGSSLRFVASVSELPAA